MLDVVNQRAGIYAAPLPPPSPPPRRYRGAAIALGVLAVLLVAVVVLLVVDRASTRDELDDTKRALNRAEERADEAEAELGRLEEDYRGAVDELHATQAELATAEADAAYFLGVIDDARLLAEDADSAHYNCGQAYSDATYYVAVRDFASADGYFADLEDWCNEAQFLNRDILSILDV